MSRRAVLLIAGVALAANALSLVPGFIYDDHRIIEQNELIAGLSRVPDIFTRGYWSVEDQAVPSLYRPVTILSFALNRAFTGPHAFGFRVVNLALHVAVTLLVLALVRALERSAGPPSSPAAAPIAALLFAVHPVHTEALGLVVGRAEILAAAGTLLSVLFFLRGRAGRPAGAPASWRCDLISIGCFVLGFLAKENAVVAPALALLAGWFVLGRRREWRYAGLAGAALAAVLAARLAVLGALNPQGFVSFIDNPIAHVSAGPALFTALEVVARYARVLILPATLSADYSFDAIPVARGVAAGSVAGALIILAWAVAWVALRRRHPPAAFAIAWIGIAFAPVSNLPFAIGTIMAERLLYLPSIGACAAAAFGVQATARRVMRSAPRTGDRLSAAAAAEARVGALRLVVGCVIAALAARGAVRLWDWRSDHAIFKAAVAAAPRNVKALFNYGAECEKAGDDAGAVAAYTEAVAIRPDFADAHYNLAGTLQRRGAAEDAIRHYREAARVEPGNVRYLVNLAIALTGAGRAGEAAALCERALGIEPRSDRAHTALGSARLALGDAAGAARAYAEALRLAPDEPRYHANLGLALERAGDAAAAAAAWRRALGLRPGDPDMIAGLASALARGGDRAGALDLLRAAAAERPDHPVLRFHLGRALEDQGDLRGAAEAYRQAARRAPGAAAPRRSLGLVLHRLGDRPGARAALEEATALDADGAVMDEAARRVLAALRDGG